MDITNKIKSIILDKIESFQYVRRGHPCRLTIGQPVEKKALLVYISESIKWSPDDYRFDRHQNHLQSRQIAETLVDCGYQTDVIDLNDDQFEPNKEYDVFIGHGKLAEKIAKSMKCCRKICLATGQYGLYANMQVLERYQNLTERSNKKLSPIFPSKVDADYYMAFDEIACFGNQYTADTFKPTNLPIHPFPNYANQNIQFLNSKNKDITHFVYIAAGNHICKGLDLLLEVFSANPTWHLHICGRISEDLLLAFEVELNMPNIHCHNYVRMGKRTFNKICEKATFYISPSCSDGMQGAALNAMQAGLIPIVTQSTGINIDRFFQLKDCSIDEITDTICKCTKITKTESEKLSIDARDFTEQRYSPDRFISTWKDIIQKH